MQLFGNEGYVTVALPKKEIKPLQLLSKTGKKSKVVEYLNGASIKDLFIKGDVGNIPAITRINTVKVLKGNSKTSFDLSSGLSMITQWFTRGGSKLKSSVKNSDRLEFSFKDLSGLQINLVNLDTFINNGKIKDEAKASVEKLKDSDIYIITSIYKSKEFSFRLVDQNNEQKELSIDIENQVKGELTRDNSSKGEYQFKYKGDEPLVFALKAAQLLYDKGTWFHRKEAIFKIKSDNKIIVRGEEHHSCVWLEDDVKEVNSNAFF